MERLAKQNKNIIHRSCMYAVGQPCIFENYFLYFKVFQTFYRELN